MPVYERTVTKNDRRVVGVWVNPEQTKLLCLKCHSEKAHNEETLEPISRYDTEDRDRIFACDGCGNQLRGALIG